MVILEKTQRDRGETPCEDRQRLEWCTYKPKDCRGWSVTVKTRKRNKTDIPYYSAIKKNSFESVLMRWMKLEPIIQSEVSQKDKDHYNILTHIYGI